MLSRPINLAIVDDHSLFRKMLKTFLAEQNKLNIVFQASETRDLFSKLKDYSVDLLVMDIFMPDTNGGESIKRIRFEYPHIRILALSMCTDMALISDLLDAGIHGYVSKAGEPEELLQAIHAVSENRIFPNSWFTEALYYNRQNSVAACREETFLALNDREKKILQLIWEEKSNKEMADELFLGVRSIEKIRQDMKEKVGVKSTVGLLKYAIKKRIIAGNSYNTSLVR